MSLTSYRTAPSRDALFWAFGPFRLFPFWGLAVVVAPSGVRWGFVSSLRDTFCVSDFTRFGGDLLSHVLRRSTIGATALNGRVRDGTGCFARAMTTKPGKIRDTFMKSYRPEGYLRTLFVLAPGGLLEDGFHQPPVPRLVYSKSCTLCILLILFPVLLLLDQIKPIGPLVPVN